MTRIKAGMIQTVIAIVVFLFSIQIPRTAEAEESIRVYNVLILNSYHQGLTWTKEESEGITDILSNSGLNISAMVEYMDWKNYPTQDNLDYLQEYFQYKYSDKEIDIIITTDDMALEFALMNRDALFADVPVVFCGVNQNGVKDIVKDQKDVTGVIEVIDPTDTVEIALTINPSLKNIYLVYDNSQSGLSTGKLVMDQMKEVSPQLTIIPCNNMEYSDLIRQVQELTDDSIVFLTTYYSDVNNQIVEMDFVTREVSLNCSVPVYHLYDFGMGKGALGGVMLSGRRQGEQAAAIALRILDGEDTDTIPILMPDTTRTAFDYQQMERFGIPSGDIPKNSEIINKPFSFYDTYKTLVLSVITVFLVLLAFVGILLFYIRKIRRMKKNLSDSHEELTQIYEELTASEEEMRQQYDEILVINEKIRQGEDKLTYLAYYDSLTGLPNKLSLYENTKALFNGKEKAALLYLDIDNFKYINDTLGHAVGDYLIMKVSEKLVSLKCDVYRLSGDEFIVVLRDIEGRAEVEEFAANIISRFSEEFDILNIELHISVSLGIVIYPEHGTNLDQLLQYSDIAMYRAKELGRKGYVVYDQQMNKVFTERVDIEKHLHNALENNEFELHYQPQFDLKNRQITGLEALLRWNNPVLGNVSPLKFIQIAEDTHIIIPLGTWVLKQACTFLKELNDRGFEDLTISVNISILQLLQTDFCDIVNETIEQMQIKPQNLELEITETMLMESFDSIRPKLEQLRHMKVRIALDDFGKGYSSLNYLKQLPINTLKVDKTFIDSISKDMEDSLTGHIVNLGKSMGLCVVAEGVERQEQLDYLVRHECDKIQGYLYCKPTTRTEIISLLEK